MKDSDKRKKTDSCWSYRESTDPAEGRGRDGGRCGSGLAHHLLAHCARGRPAADSDVAGYEEKDVIQEFEDTHGVKVEFKIYIGGEQMLQFFNQTPRGTYDNVLVDAEYVRKLAALDAIEPYNPGEITELANYHPKFSNMYQVQAGDGMVWGTLTRFSFYAISYNSDHMSFEESGDWNSLLPAQVPPARSASSTGICRTWAMPASRFIPTKRIPTT